MKNHFVLLAALLCLFPAARGAPVPGGSERRAAVLQGVLRYDSEYPEMRYSQEATHNAIYRLQQRLDRDEVRLEFKPGRGYVDSLLVNLGIDASSQLLVYSKTSLQIDWISAAAPRAIYFNDDTAIAWENGAPLLEITTMDSSLGPVFYVLSNRPWADGFNREGSRCLNCHDRFGMMGGGVPNFLATSSFVDINGLVLRPDETALVTDQTPLELRWGGWYVTGRHGRQVHMGNIHVHSATELGNLEKVRRGNLDKLDDLFDTRPYLLDRSDIVALLVFEHQSTVYNLITRVNFKLRSLLARSPQLLQGAAVPLHRMVEPLVQALLFVTAAPLTQRIAGSSGFDAWFQRQGPRDPQGRSLRQLDLSSRLFTYPLSFLIYSDAFDALPESVRLLVYQRLEQILTGADKSAVYARLSASQRQTLLDILTTTKPAFRDFLRNTAAPN